MQYQAQYLNFNNLLTQYLKVNDGFTVKGEVEALSRELTNISKQHYFLDLGIRYIFNEPIEKDKLVFVTSLIKDKFKFDFQLVEREKLLFYYNKICEMGHFLGCKYYPVYTNLSLALTYLYIHISAHSEEQLEVFLKPFIPSDPKDYQFFNFYFKIMECLAVEIDNSRLVIDEEFREIAKNKLLAQQYSILIKLNEITTAAWEIESIDNENILQCFIEWVTISYNPQVLNSLPNHYAMNKLFEYIQDDRRTNQTAECLKRLILHLSNPSQVPIFYDYLGKKVVELLSVVDYFAEQAELSEAEDYLRIIVEFCRKSITSFIVNFDDRIYKFLQRLAKYTQDEMIEAFETLIDFWEEFITEIIKQKSKITIHPQIASLIEEVYDSVCQKCYYSLKIINQLNTRPQNKLYEFNRSAQDTYSRRQYSHSMFQKIAEFYGKVIYLQVVYKKIQIISQKSEQFLWPYLEVYLFSLAQSLKKMEKNCNEISNIIGIYVQLTNKENLKVPTILKKTFLNIFRSLMSIQEKDVNFVKLLFNLTSTCFEDELLMPYAEKTFSKGCQYNHVIMKENAEQIMSLLQKYPNRDHIVKGIIHLICPYQDIVQKFLPSIFVFLFGKLKESVGEKLLNKQIMYSITGIVKVLQEVAPDHQGLIGIVRDFTRLAFPFILQTVKNPKRLSNDEDPQVERMIKLIKIIMRYLKFQFTEFIQPLYNAVIQVFPKYPICSYAYLLEIAITVFYENEQYTEYFKTVYVKFCSILFVHMNQIEKMEKYSYLLDDFIGISKRFFVYNASIVLNSGQLPNIIQLCTTAFIGSDTPRIAKAAYTFFETIFMVYWRQEFIDDYNEQLSGQKFVRKVQDQALYFQLKNLLTQKLQYIVTKILEHLSQAPSQSTRQQILFVLTSEIKAFPQENCQFWPKILSLLPSDILVSNEKVRFLSNLGLVASNDFNVAKEAVRFVRKYVYLMNKRMVNANNRKYKN